jgi:hypothetical protein
MYDLFGFGSHYRDPLQPVEPDILMKLTVVNISNDFNNQSVRHVPYVHIT